VAIIGAGEVGHVSAAPLIKFEGQCQ